jgi:hypothetical protein
MSKPSADPAAPPGERSSAAQAVAEQAAPAAKPETPAAPPAPAEARDRAAADPALPEEVDVWWGSYSGRTMMPSLLVCLLLTGAIAWASWYYLPARLVRLTIFGLVGAVWLAQTVRWAYRIFGFNYRLTTRRLFRDRGFLYTDAAQAELTGIAQVVVESTWYERLVGVGDVRVLLEDRNRPPLVLEGVRDPEHVANQVQALVKQAREQQVVAVRV